jgi:polyhydroxybutyrate depolymerase
VLALLGVAVAMSGASVARAAVPCVSTLAPGTHPIEIVSDHIARTALVHVPPSLPIGKHVPLVLALHGWGGSGARMESYSGFSQIADEEGFDVAYPNSDGPGWNSTGKAGAPDDVAFLRALIDYVERNGCVDRQRVFAAGVSNGGGMVALAACELATQLAAVAAVAGAYDGQPPCTPALPVSVLEIHGTADPVAPYFGERARRTRDGLPPFVDGWAYRDGCQARPPVREIAPRTSLYRWGWCTSGVLVEHIRIQGGRHQWPGATPPDPGPPATICASCTIWRFFAAAATERRWSLSGGAGLQQSPR